MAPGPFMAFQGVWRPVTPVAALLSCPLGEPAASIASPRFLAFSGLDSGLGTGPVVGAVGVRGVVALEIEELEDECDGIDDSTCVALSEFS